MQEVVIVGGLEMQQQAKALARRPHVVVATPGRLKVCVLPAQSLQSTLLRKSAFDIWVAFTTVCTCCYIKTSNTYHDYLLSRDTCCCMNI